MSYIIKHPLIKNPEFLVGIKTTEKYKLFGNNTIEAEIWRVQFHGCDLALGRDQKIGTFTSENIDSELKKELDKIDETIERIKKYSKN